MSEKWVRIVLGAILSFGVGVGVIQVAMLAWPDASLFTPLQSLCVLSSMFLWCIVGIRCVIAVVGGVGR